MSETSTIVSYRTNEDGKKVKVTTKVTTEYVPLKENDDRYSWPRYGDAVNDQNKPVKGEDITLRLFPKSTRPNKEAEQQAKPTSTTRYVCKTCKGDHLTYKCPHKDSIATTDDSLTSGIPSTTVPGVEGSRLGAGAAAANKYVPPSLRAAMGGVNGMGVPGMALPGMGAPQSRDVSSTLRVSNLPETITEGVLRTNFSYFGRIARCHVPQSKVTGRPRGFAFIEFDTPAQADNARKNFDGVAVDSMIMHVEFAQPRD